MKEKKLYSKKGVGIVLVCAITLCSCSTGETSKNDFNKHKLEISGQGTKIKMVSENFSNQTGDGIKDAVTYLSNTKGDTSDEKEVIEFNENTVALNEGDKSYIYQLVEEDDKTYVDMYNENGELLQQSIMENEGEEVVDVSYCDNIEEESDKQDVSEEPLEITVKDIDEVVETEEVGATEYGNEIAKESTQSRNVNSDRLEQNANLTNCNTSSLSNNMENGIINLSKNSIYYLKYENLFSNNNLDLNNGLGKGWFYLGGKSYSGCISQ